MTAPRLEIDLDKIYHNAHTLVERLTDRGISVGKLTDAGEGTDSVIVIEEVEVMTVIVEGIIGYRWLCIFHLRGHGPMPPLEPGGRTDDRGIGIHPERVRQGPNHISLLVQVNFSFGPVHGDDLAGLDQFGSHHDVQDAHDKALGQDE